MTGPGDLEQTMPLDALRVPGSGDAVLGYRLGDQLGRGANGTVYAAVRADGQAGEFAVKIVDLTGQPPDFRERLVRECAVAGKFRHPHLVAVHAYGPVGPSVFAIAMDLARGTPCDRLADGALGWELAARVVRAAAAALDAALSQAGVIHRDVKPANMVAQIEGGQLLGLRLIDFGLARTLETPADQGGLTIAGQAMGTPHYMSPEQARGETGLDFRTDIYALGASLFHLVAGKPPFTGRSPVEILVCHLKNAPPDLATLVPACPRRLATLVARCLSKEPGRRHASYADLLRDLDQCLEGDPFASDQLPAGGGTARHAATTGRTRPAWQAPTEQMDRGGGPVWQAPAGGTAPVWRRPLTGSQALAGLVRSKLAEGTGAHRRGGGVAGVSTARPQAEGSGEPPTPTPAPPPAAAPKAVPPPPPGGRDPEVVLTQAPGAAAAPVFLPGTRIGGEFEVLSVLGVGGMGEVYAVRERITGRELALKTITREGQAHPGALRRFRAEASALAALSDTPGFPYFAGRGQHLGCEYLLMERLRGVDLRTLLRARGHLPEGEALWVARELATAMEAAYRTCGMVHRDLKPANLMLVGDAGDRLKIVDFGISAYIDFGDFAEFTVGPSTYADDGMAGLPVGTPAYMAPEQAAGEAPTPFMDIYAFGALLFHLLAGRTPYQAASAPAMMLAHQRQRPPRLEDHAESTPATAQLVHRCLAKNPRERFRSWSQLLAAVQAAAFSLSTQIRRRQTPG